MKSLITQTKIPPGEITRLSVYLRGWTVLNQLFQVDEIPDVTLEKLMTIEKQGQNRKDILARLAGRYMSNQSAKLRQTLGLPPPRTRTTKK